MVLFDPEGRYLIGGELQLQTKKGNQIPNERRPERHPESMQVAHEIVKTHHTTAKCRSLCSSYNCMGLVFGSRRTCIDTDSFLLIKDDDELTRVSSIADVVVGDIIVYRDNFKNITHVGLVIEKKPKLVDGSYELNILSQWGADGEYFHRIDDVNKNLGTPAEFWTDRR
jgi:hypothetical protein